RCPPPGTALSALRCGQITELGCPARLALCCRSSCSPCPLCPPPAEVAGRKHPPPPTWRLASRSPRTRMCGCSMRTRSASDTSPHHVRTNRREARKRERDASRQDPGGTLRDPSLLECDDGQ